MWPFNKDKNGLLKNCLNTSKKTLLDLQATCLKNNNPVAIINDLRFQIAKSLITINKILDNLK